MNIIRFLFVAFLIWFTFAAVSPFFDIYFWITYIEAPLNDSIAFQRAVTVRSAIFLTLSYFVINYLRNRKPLSSIVPIMIFTIFYSVFRTGFLIKNGGPNTEWIIVAFTTITSAMLYLEYKNETNKIFANSW